jgi:hypothetical protein
MYEINILFTGRGNGYAFIFSTESKPFQFVSTLININYFNYLLLARLN